MATTYDVELYVYDLSQGFAAMMSEPLLGKFSSQNFDKFSVNRIFRKIKKFGKLRCHFFEEKKFFGNIKTKLRIDIFRISIGRNLSHRYCRLWKRILLRWRNFWVWCDRIRTTRHDTIRYDSYCMTLYCHDISLTFTS